jgi:hypothetical protein
MRVMIPFKNPKTNEIKKVKLGFSWTLLLFSGIFGFPLFLRKLYVWAVLMLVLWLVNLFVSNTSYDPLLIFGLAIVLFIPNIWLAFRGNEITAKNYLENGWEFYEPDNDLTKMAKQKWIIAS